MSPDRSAGPATAEFALPIPDSGLADRLRERMAAVEAALFAHASSPSPYVTEAARHLLSAGGKRFRPLLVLLAAEAGTRPDAAEVLTACTGSPWFPAGMGSFIARKNQYLVFERGPSQMVVLQWASYFDAADQAGLSRRFGGKVYSEA